MEIWIGSQENATSIPACQQGFCWAVAFSSSVHVKKDIEIPRP